jgi:HEAT repeat protein
MVYAVGTLGPSAKDAVPELVARANSPDVQVRWRVAWALDRIGAKDATVAASLRPLLKDAFSTARGYAASAYAKAVGFDATLLSELEPLLDDPDPFPRAEASQALAKGRSA